MRIPLEWIREFVPKMPTGDRLAELLLSHGLESEKVAGGEDIPDSVIVGEIVELRAHPNAERLQLARVSTAPGQVLDIVCGAWNIRVGQKVPVATIGSRLPNGLRILARPVRGVNSQGMLCAEDELGLGVGHEGILILPPSATTGKPVSQVLARKDEALDISVPANRADLMSAYGLGREIAAILGRRWQEETFRLAAKTDSGATLKAIIEDRKLCDYYSVTHIENLRFGESPSWMRCRLEGAGMRPLNIVVDITNYVMLELGNPLHAFDAASIKGKQIFVRQARAGETLVTLDGQKRALDKQVIVIADASGPIALAGIMGGRATEVSKRTTDIYLESAIFNAPAVRRAARSLGIQSEAVKRFEKGLWPELSRQSRDRAAELLVKYAGGRVVGARDTGRRRTAPRVIALEPEYVSDRLGFRVASSTMLRVLRRLGMKTATSARRWRVSVPVWRSDVQDAQDLVDEVGRLIGFDQASSKLPVFEAAPMPLPAMHTYQNQLRDALLGLGLTEVLTHSYYGSEDRETVGGEHVEVANPLDRTQQYLRKSLVPSMKRILMHAIDAGRDARIFQVGRVFEVGGKEVESWQAYKLCFGVARKLEDEVRPEWDPRSMLRALRDEIRLADMPRIEQVSETRLKGRSLVCIELDVDALRKSSGPRVYQPVAPFPAVRRSYTLVPGGRSYAEVMKVVREGLGEVANLLKINQTWAETSRIGGEHRLTIHLTFQAEDRTLTKEELDRLEDKMKRALQTAGVWVQG